jgi:hypothetical protein
VVSAYNLLMTKLMDSCVSQLLFLTIFVGIHFTKATPCLEGEPRNGKCKLASFPFWETLFARIEKKNNYLKDKHGLHHLPITSHLFAQKREAENRPYCLPYCKLYDHWRSQHMHAMRNISVQEQREIKWITIS